MGMLRNQKLNQLCNTCPKKNKKRKNRRREKD